MSERPYSEPSVSVVVPVHDGGRAFARCLAALAAADPPPLEVVVAIDGSRDASAAIARDGGCRVVDLPRRGGPARARNAGSALARGDVLLFVDADVVVRPDVVGRVARRFDADPQLAALFGSYDDAPDAPNFLSQYKNLLHHYTHQTARERATTFWSGCGAVRRRVFLEAGGFDEGYRCVEDIELGYRLTRAGHTILVDKELQAKHLKRWTPASLLRADVFCRALPWTAMIAEGYPMVDDLNLRLASRLSVVLVYALVAAAAAAALWPAPAAAGAGAVATALLFLNRDLYGFFRRKRGLRFAALAVVWHWFYYFYSGAAFGAGFLAAALRRRRGAGRAPRAAAAQRD